MVVMKESFQARISYNQISIFHRSCILETLLYHRYSRVLHSKDISKVDSTSIHLHSLKSQGCNSRVRSNKCSHNSIHFSHRIWMSNNHGGSLIKRSSNSLKMPMEEVFREVLKRNIIILSHIWNSQGRQENGERELHSNLNLWLS